MKRPIRFQARPAVLAAGLLLCGGIREAGGAKKRPRGLPAFKPGLENAASSVKRIAAIDAHDPFQARIEQIKRQIAEDMSGLPAKLDELRKLAPLYEATENLNVLEPARGELRRELSEGADRLNENAVEFHKIRKDYQFQQGVLLFSKMIQGEPDDSLKRNYEVLFDLGNYDKSGILDYKDEIREALAKDQTRLQGVIDERARAELHKKLLKGGAAALGAMLLLALLWFRRRAPAPHLPLSHPPRITAEPASAAANPPARPEDLVGALLDGRFAVEELLKTGALGPVYEAADRKDGGKTILKTIDGAFQRTSAELERMLARIKECGALSHVALAEIKSVFLHEDLIYVAAEKVEGMPLSRFIDPSNRIELRSIKLIASQIALLLDAAHERKILHGDIRPSNIIVTENGAVKVLDLGLGAEARKAARAAGLSRRIGDPAYFAPEQELGTEFRQSDFYSLGIICYAMLTGRLPFEGPNFLAQKRERRYPPASGFSEKIPVEIDPVLHKALEPEPQNRYQKGMDFFNALDAVPEAAEN